jgi:hypothetical protein
MQLEILEKNALQEVLNLYSLPNWENILGFRWETSVLCISEKTIHGCEQDLSGYRIVLMRKDL